MAHPHQKCNRVDWIFHKRFEIALHLCRCFSLRFEIASKWRLMKTEIIDTNIKLSKWKHATHIRHLEFHSFRMDSQWLHPCRCRVRGGFSLRFSIIRMSDTCSTVRRECRVQAWGGLNRAHWVHSAFGESQRDDSTCGRIILCNAFK